MCLINSNIVEAKNKEVKRKADSTYEERCKIEISKLDKKQRRTVVYYTDPYSSWQKGMNENCNGILRRFIPKGTDLFFVLIFCT